MTSDGCPTGKTRYDVLTARRRAKTASQRTDERITAYRCTTCNSWHLGHGAPSFHRPIPIINTNHSLSLT